MAYSTFTTNGWNLILDGSCGEYWLHQHDSEGKHPKFVARFKYGNAQRCGKHFAKFLVKHFTPAEYFAAYTGPGSAATPFGVLQTKGFVDYNTQRAHRYAHALHRRQINL